MPSASLLVPRAEPDETSRDLGTARKKPFAELVPKSAFSPTTPHRSAVAAITAEADGSKIC